MANELIRCVRCEYAFSWDDMCLPCGSSPDGGPHEGIAPVSQRRSGWSLHSRDCPRAAPFVIGNVLMDAACTCKESKPRANPAVEITEVLTQQHMRKRLDRIAARLARQLGLADADGNFFESSVVDVEAMLDKALEAIPVSIARPNVTRHLVPLTIGDVQQILYGIKIAAEEGYDEVQFGQLTHYLEKFIRDHE